jgi:hypothetical protein
MILDTRNPFVLSDNLLSLVYPKLGLFHYCYTDLVTLKNCYYKISLFTSTSLDVSVHIVIIYGLENRGLKVQSPEEIRGFLSFRVSRLVLRPTDAPIQ